jgi:hypothetical protein
MFSTFRRFWHRFFPGFLHATADRASAWYSTVDGQNYLLRGIFPHGKLTHPVVKPAKRAIFNFIYMLPNINHRWSKYS